MPQLAIYYQLLVRGYGCVNTMLYKQIGPRPHCESGVSAMDQRDGVGQALPWLVLRATLPVGARPQCVVARCASRPGPLFCPHLEDPSGPRL